MRLRQVRGFRELGDVDDREPGRDDVAAVFEVHVGVYAASRPGSWTERDNCETLARTYQARILLMEAELVDRIYECCFVPELWPEVLRDTSKLSQSAGASL
jgi:hypothetical protein